MPKNEKGLSQKELDQEILSLKQKDTKFASRLHILQDRHFPKRLKNMSEWAEAEKVKRLILGMNTDKQEHSGAVRLITNVEG